MPTDTIAIPGKRVWVVDCEVFGNYFLAVFYNGVEYREFDHTQLPALAGLLHAKGLVLAGFNNFDYDDCVLRAIAEKPTITTDEIFRLSFGLIQSNEFAFQHKYKQSPWAWSIDVFQLLNKKNSLKEWQCRIGYDNVLESPVDFTKPLEETCKSDVIAYCRNDAASTWELLKCNWHLVTLRDKLNEQFSLGTRIYCLSEQGVAQHTFLTLNHRRTGKTNSEVRTECAANPVNAQTSFPIQSLVSSKIAFDTPTFREFYDSFLSGSVCCNEGSWSIANATSQYDDILLGGIKLSFGVGGLHSIDGPLIAQSTDTTKIIDLDVTSYYPSIIINERLYPEQLGPGFVDDMVMLRDLRVKGKRAGDKYTADALKIVVNSTFGKLNDTWSPLRSTDNAHRVTINGQLFILMLLEDLSDAGATIISANTDGITIMWDAVSVDQHLRRICDAWQTQTGFELERTNYTKIYRRDVNTYIAITDVGKIKYKGAINPDSGKGDGVIIKDAAEAYLLHGVDPHNTIGNCNDHRKFLFYTRCKNGGSIYFEKQKIGKSCRWYAAFMGGQVERLNPATPRRKEGFAKLPHGASTMLALDITDWSMPADLNKQYYEEQSWELIRSIEFACPGPQASTQPTESSETDSSSPKSVERIKSLPSLSFSLSYGSACIPA